MDIAFSVRTCREEYRKLFLLPKLLFFSPFLFVVAPLRLPSSAIVSHATKTGINNLVAQTFFTNQKNSLPSYHFNDKGCREEVKRSQDPLPFIPKYLQSRLGMAGAFAWPSPFLCPLLTGLLDSTVQNNIWYWILHCINLQMAFQAKRGIAWHSEY